MIKLTDAKIELTELEKRTLNCIADQGSYYEEGLNGEDVSKLKSTFLGYEIDEDEIPGCRGALSSLVKKGVLQVVNGEDMQMYYIKYLLDFLPNTYHTIQF